MLSFARRVGCPGRFVANPVLRSMPPESLSVMRRCQVPTGLLTITPSFTANQDARLKQTHSLALRMAAHPGKRDQRFRRNRGLRAAHASLDHFSAAVRRQAACRCGLSEKERHKGFCSSNHAYRKNDLIWLHLDVLGWRCYGRAEIDNWAGAG